MSEAPEIKVGQIWQEVDPRFPDRFIRVESVRDWGKGIGIRRVVKSEDMWVEAPRSRSANAKTERFNGKRGGYRLIEEPQS